MFKKLTMMLLLCLACVARADSPDAETVIYNDHSNLLIVRDNRGHERPIKTRDDWAIRRNHIRANIELIMGPLPGAERRVPLDVQILSEENTDRYIRRKVEFTPESGDRVRAWLLVPNGIDPARPVPAMLCLHQTNNVGKDEPVGLGGLANLRYAQELAERRFVCVAPDYPSFGEYKYDFKTQGAHYASGSMKAIWNNLRAVDLLETLPEVNKNQIGAIGHSLGGHNALFTAFFDERLKAVVTSCGFCPFHDYYGGKLQGWTSDRYMPRIREIYGNDPNKVTFDFYEILAGIAPRAVFSNSPVNDSNFDVAGVRKAFAKSAAIFELYGVPNRLKLVTPDAQHDFPDEQRKQAYDWLSTQLK